MRYLPVFLLCCLSAAVHAQVRLPKIFGDSMVLQRDRSIPVWGWAAPNESVTVSFHNQKKTARADRAGRWKATLAPEAAGGPYTLTVTGRNRLSLAHVLVGDVWICSGQSNMEWPVAASNHAAREISTANYPQIRHFKVANDISEGPREDLKNGSGWKSATPQNTGAFTAVGYFFARELHQALGIPVGLINTTWGGTDIETWISGAALAGSDEFRTLMGSLRTLNLDSVARAKQRAVQENISRLQGRLPDAAAAEAWSSENLDHSAWPRMNVPGIWEGSALGDLDGVVWFRRTVDVAPEDAGKPARLQLAMIDDQDVTYINGTRVGATNGYNQKRSYEVPAGVLKGGRNVLAVRVNDTGGGGGFHGDGADMVLTIGGRSLPLSGAWSFSVASVQTGSTVMNPNSFPALLYNAMVHPLIPFAMKGVLWYQGENNAGRAWQYRTAFPLLITDWRSRWGQGDFPFYFVQLASFNAANGNSRTGSTWAELREAQAATLALPNTGMAVTTDVGEPGDIHPRNKQDVGRRLAAIALHRLYGKGTVSGGPVFQSMKVEGNRAVLSFAERGGGLEAKDKYGYLKGFEIAGADRQFHPARAFVEGSQVVVYQEGVQQPVAVRYAWADEAGEANLYNKEGFPAVPFRTDNWKGITEGARYTVRQ